MPRQPFTLLSLLMTGVLLAWPSYAAPADETSVRPGANAQYFGPEMRLQEWIDRFERGGREIFDHRHAILEATGIRPGMMVADVGAGTGLFTLEFARMVGPSGRIYAVDIVPKFLTHIARKAKDQHINNVKTVLGTGRAVSLAANSIDVAFLCDAYHHFEYPRNMNASLFKALRPGGTLVLIDFRRVAGQSPQWVLEHVRAGEEVFTAELQAAGFEKVESLPVLAQNYFVRFRKPPGQK
jgi:ubiquinone/menaquinone biosynthesis C-methylase UbiE